MKFCFSNFSIVFANWCAVDVLFAFTAAVKCISYDNIPVQKGLKLSLPASQHSSANAEEQTEDNKVNGATTPSQDIADSAVQNSATVGRHALSTGCLLSSNTTSPEFSTSAKLTDHFPQKTLTPSSGNSVRSSRPSSSVPSTPSTEEPRAPVASLDDSDSPSLERKSTAETADSVEAAETPRSQSSDTSQNQSQSVEENSQVKESCHAILGKLKRIL